MGDTHTLTMLAIRVTQGAPTARGLRGHLDSIVCLLAGSACSQLFRCHSIGVYEWERAGEVEGMHQPRCFSHLVWAKNGLYPGPQVPSPYCSRSYSQHTHTQSGTSIERPN